MGLMVVESDISGYQAFCNKIEGMHKFSTFSSYLECLGEVSKDDVIVLHYDGNNELDKAISQFRKVNLDLKVIVFYADATEEEIVDHSGSKFAADLYMTTHLEEDELAENLKSLGLTPQFLSEATKTLALGIVHEHVMDKSLSANAQHISEKLDKVFSAQFFKEYQNDKKNGRLEEVQELSISEVDMSDEIDLDIPDEELEVVGEGEETGLTQAFDPGEINLEDNGGIEELEFGVTEEIESEEVNIGEIDLDGEEEADPVEMKQGEEVEDPADINLDDDLSFSANLGELSEDLGTDNSSEEENSSTEDDGFSLDEETIEFMDDENPSQVMDLGDSLEESLNLEEDSGLNDVDLSAEGTDFLEPTTSFQMTDDIKEELNDGGEELDFGMDSELGTETIKGVKMTSVEELNSSPTDTDDDMLDDIKTKMLEIDKLLLSNDKAEESVTEIEEDADFSLSEEPLIESGFEKEEEELLDLKEAVKAEPVKSLDVNNNPPSGQFIQEHQAFQRSHEEELIRLGETISSLRSDREQLMNRIQELENQKSNEKKDFLSLRAELDEKKIEIAIVKKRFSKQIEDLNVKLDMVESRKDVLFEQNKKYEEEFDKIRRENKTDLNKVRHRERELEERLELLRNDADIQIQNRDHKILELKRRIDTLEFDIENAQIKERKSVDDQQVLEDKMSKVIQTLRSAIGDLEDDGTMSLRDRLIKKNLDV